MRALFRHLVLLAIAAALSWRVLLYQPEKTGAPAPPAPVPVSVAVIPRVEPEPAPSQAAPAPATPVEQAEPEADSSDDPPPPAPPPPEAGTPEGEEDAEEAPTGGGEAAGEQVAPDDTVTAMDDPALLAEAARELSGEVRKGFSTVFLAHPEEQLEIGRYFGETILLVPKAALDPQNPSPHYFQVTLNGPPAVQRVPGRPPLDSFRQYRDFFSYPYAKLPEVLRELRRTVLARNEILLFGALLPPREWALAIDRRRRALAATGHDSSEVREFVLRYIRTNGGGYDFQVGAIRLADGTLLDLAPTTSPQSP